MRPNNRKGVPRKYDRTAVCARCGMTFERYPGKQKGKRTFCGRGCYNAQLGEDNLKRRVNQKGGLTKKERLKISKTHKAYGYSSDTYEKTLGRHTHRVVAEKMLQRPLTSEEVVHHIDGNKRNNHPDNLMVFPSASEHVKWHIRDGSFSRTGGDEKHV